MQRFLSGIFLFCFCCFITSCKKYKAADEAFLLKANSVSLSTLPGQGSGTNKITDLWLYKDGKFQGAYPIGNLMPVITNGKKTKINILAGIKNNGISNTRLPYVFYQYATLDTFVENQTILEKQLVFTYLPATTFTWTENFDGNGISLINSSVSQTTLVTISDPESLEGKYGLLALTGNSIVAQAESSTSYTLPTASSNVYLEFDYKCNQDFEIGLIGNLELKPALSITGRSEWNHIYIRLADVIGSGHIYSSYSVYFKMVKSIESPKLYLDNIKLLYL